MSDNFKMYKQLLSGGSTSDMSLFCNNKSDDLIIIGGTREQTFNLPFNYKLIDKLELLYNQDNTTVLRKNLNDLTVSKIDPSLVYFMLSEADTFLFKEGEIVVQLKARLKDGEIIVSDILHLNAINAIDNSLMSGNQLIALRISVNDRDVVVNSYTDLISEISSNKLSCTYKCKFLFDSSWDNFDKVVLFKDEYNHLVQMDIINDECYIPFVVLQNPGNIYVGISGSTNDRMIDSEGKEHIISFNKVTTWSNSVRVISSPHYDIATKYFNGDSDIIKDYKNDGLMSIDVAVTQDIPEIVISFEGVE